jgi:class 3 adenylate cyclase
MESSRPLPTGVVTFLMTDIEGSTRLWEREPEAMRRALLRHDAVVAACVQGRNGHVVKSKGEGDSVFAVFPHVRDAVSAALIAQCALAAERWTTSTPLRVRMAIHTGQIELRDGDYYGPTVNRCARLRALATGGQVLLSGVTAQLTQRQLPGGASLRDLGTHPLKDLAGLERVWQLVHPQMPGAVSDPTEAPLAAPPKAPSHRAYKLTDHLNRTADGREWSEGAKYTVSGFGGPNNDSRIRCYASPGLAALLNVQYEQFRLPRLWEATVDVEITPGDAIVACREVTTTRQITLPTLGAQHHAQFAVHCARAAYEGGLHATEFNAWAECWLAGQDSSGHNARALADELDRDAHRGNDLAHPEDVMAANAARAAMHASRVSWLGGRAREEENARGIELATEAVHTALRITNLDLPSLADQVVPKVPGPVLPIRPLTTPVPNRILRALPT